MNSPPQGLFEARRAGSERVQTARRKGLPVLQPMLALMGDGVLLPVQGLSHSGEATAAGVKPP